MISLLENLKRNLEKSELSLKKLIQFTEDLFANISLLYEVFKDELSVQRYMIDQLRGELGRSFLQNQKLIHLNSKLLNNPELVDFYSSQGILNELSSAFNSIQEEHVGGFIEGIFSENLSDLTLLILSDYVKYNPNSWEEWNFYLEDCRNYLQTLIQQFPIENKLSPALVSLEISLCMITVKIKEQSKIQSTYEALTAMKDSTRYSEHSAYFLFDILRLEQKMKTLPQTLAEEEE